MKLIYRQTSRRALLLGAVVLVPLFFILFLLQAGVIESAVVSSESMSPTLLKFDRVIVDLRRDYQPRRGDIVTFSNPEEHDRPLLVKRIIGLEGDLVSVKNGKLFLDGEPWNGPLRLDESEKIKVLDVEIVVPPGHFFAVGDNINASFDSFQFGSLPLEQIKGKLRMIYWPPSRLRRLDAFPRRG